MVAAIAPDFDFDADADADVDFDADFDFGVDFDLGAGPASARRNGGRRVVSGRPSTLALYRPTAAPGPVARASRHHPIRRRRHSASVYRRRRILVAGALAVVVIGVWGAVRAVAADSDPVLAPSRPIASRVYVVHAGDTLWGIALASGDKGDIRPLVDELSAEVHNQPLQVGEQITLP